MMTKQELLAALSAMDDRQRVCVVLNGMVREIAQVSPYGQNTIWIEAESDATENQSTQEWLDSRDNYGNDAGTYHDED